MRATTLLGGTLLLAACATPTTQPTRLDVDCDAAKILEKSLTETINHMATDCPPDDPQAFYAYKECREAVLLGTHVLGIYERNIADSDREDLNRADKFCTTNIVQLHVVLLLMVGNYIQPQPEE